MFFGIRPPRAAGHAGQRAAGKIRLSLFLFSLLGLFTAVAFTFTAQARSDKERIAYGPAEFEPGISLKFFKVGNTNGPFTLVLENGDPASGEHRVFGAQVWLNGKAVVTADEVTQASSTIEKPVTQEKLNLLIVTVKGDPGSYITLTIRSGEPNTQPVANAGPDQTVPVYTLVHLDGSASSDAGGSPLTFNWLFTQRPAASNAALFDPTAVQPTFTVDQPGDYTVRLIVNNGTLDSAPDEVNVSTANSPPVANAGPDQSAFVDDTVTLDGRASSDADGDALTYRWSFTSKPAGSTAQLSDTTVVQPSFGIDLPGTYSVQLIVNDGTVDSPPDTVAINTVNSAPVANAGPDRSVFVDDTVTLDGSGSSDVDGDALTYRWSLTSKPAGSTAQLSDTAAVRPTFDVDLPGTYIVQLIVNDGTVDSPPDTVTINIVNSPPVANAGPDQSVFVYDTVTLDGSGSSDVDGDTLTYRWSFTSKPVGSTAQLSDTATVQPSFDVDLPGTYLVQLIVNDGAVDSAPNQVMISTLNSRPVANAGVDQTATVGDTVTLDGSGSSDADGDVLNFAWSLLTQPADSTTTLSGADTDAPTLTPDYAGDYVAQLIVSDGLLDSNPDSALVMVNAAPDNQPPQITSTPVTAAIVGVPYSYDVEATDPEGEALIYSLTASPAGMTIGPATGLIEWTPGSAGDVPVRVQVADPQTATDTQDFSITVTGVVVTVTVPNVVGETRAAAETAITESRTDRRDRDRAERSHRARRPGYQPGPGRRHRRTAGHGSELRGLNRSHRQRPASGSRQCGAAK